MYKIEKLTVKNRCEIPVHAVVEVEVAESIHIHSDLGKQCYGSYCNDSRSIGNECR